MTFPRVMQIIGKTSDLKRSIVKDISYKVSNNKESLRFIFLFSLFSVLFFIPYFIFQKELTGLLLFTAWLVSVFSNLVGMSIVVDGVFLDIGAMTFEIIHECTGIFAILISVSSILAYPSKWREKTIGILLVIPFILFLNICRILFLIYIGKYHTSLFEFVHSYLWQGTFIIFIILAWFLWIELVVDHER
jgi:archaeosortase B (VPXXXP-CTERM-specific)